MAQGVLGHHNLYICHVGRQHRWSHHFPRLAGRALSRLEFGALCARDSAGVQQRVHPIYMRLKHYSHNRLIFL